MSDIHTYSLLGSVLVTSVWSVICLNKTDRSAAKAEDRPAGRLLSQSGISANGILSMVPPLERLKSADF